jgi:SHS2 domain-containing protein
MEARGEQCAMEQRFRFLDHTADAKFQAFGRTMEEAFANAALATASLMWDTGMVERKVRHALSTRGRDLEQLLVHFLQEIIYLLETKAFLLGAAEEVKIKKEADGFSLAAVFAGDNHSGRYKIFGEVKAITYNEMKIEKNDHITVQVVVDI